MPLRLFLRVVCIAVCLSGSFSSRGQANFWNYLPNVGYDIIDTTNAVRTEDIYFTDTLTGFGVSLTGYILKTIDGGGHWTHFHSVNARFRSIEFLADGLTGIAGSLNGYTFRTTDGGSTWVDITSSIHDTLLTDGPGNICGLAHLGDRFYGVGWWGGKHPRVYKSTDKGLTWQTTYVDTALATNLVDVYFSSPDTGFATGGVNATTTNYISTEAVVLKTTDGGATWIRVFHDTTIGGRIWKIQYVNSNLLVGSLEPYYYHDSVNMIKSTDGGDTWTLIHAGSFHNSTFAATDVIQGIGFMTPLRGFLGGYCNGMFETYDGGATWDTISFGVNVNRIFVLDANHAYAGGRHVYKWGSFPSGVQNTPSSIRSSNTLYPVVPNPSKGDVTITFDIGRETNVVLEVASVDSRKGTQILNRQLPAGRYVYKWSSANEPNGNYIIWLGTDEIPLTQKFVLSR